MVSLKFEDITHDTFFDETEIKLLVSNSKPQIHKKSLKSTMC